MPEHHTLDTDRLLLRQWTPQDREPFARLNADPRVMEFFPSVLSRDESDAMAERCESLILHRGWGFWAVELRHSREFIGFVGLHVPSAPLPFAPCVEVGWRLGVAHWGHGYASEAAKAAIAFGFRALGLTEIVAFTSLLNDRSRKLMARLGMSYAGDFEHPSVPVGSKLRQHCLYRLTRASHDA